MYAFTNELGMLVFWAIVTVVWVFYAWVIDGVLMGWSYWWFIVASRFVRYGHGIPKGGRVSLVSMNIGYFHNQHF